MTLKVKNKNLLFTVLSSIVISACNMGANTPPATENKHQEALIMPGAKQGMNSQNPSLNTLGIVNGQTNFDVLSQPVQQISKASVALIITFTDNTRQACTGVALSRTQVLTAAHCFTKKSTTKGIQAFQKVSFIDVLSNPISSTDYERLTKIKFVDNKISYNNITNDDYVKLELSELRKTNFLLSDNLGNYNLFQYQGDKKVDGETFGMFNLKDVNQKTIFMIGSQGLFGGCSSLNDCQFQYAAIPLLTVNNQIWLFKQTTGQIQEFISLQQVIAEPGDSGGPVFACTNFSNARANCKLIGITQKGQGLTPSLILITPILGS